MDAGPDVRRREVHPRLRLLTHLLRREHDLAELRAGLEPHGGDLGGFFLLRGERDSIARVRASDDLVRLAARAQLIVDSFGIVGAETGARIEEQMGIFLQAAGELA